MELKVFENHYNACRIENAHTWPPTLKHILLMVPLTDPETDVRVHACWRVCTRSHTCVRKRERLFDMCFI